MYVLGLWDGHDAGAALIRDNEIVYAANEERFTKRKLEVNFPYHSIAAALAYAKIKPADVEHVAFTTTEFTKTLERMFPVMRENYYNFRRRKMLKPRFENFRHELKYSLTSVGILPGCNSISSSIIRKHLGHMGFQNYKLHIVEHHTAHAATAAYTSPFSRSLIVTTDGLGDGLSATVNTFENGKINRHIKIGARDSLGIFFEQATNIIGMREQEDEGKLMAMADYSYPFPFDDNILRHFFSASGTIVKARYGPVKQFNMLQRIAWKTPREQFSYYVQQLFSNIITKIISNSMDRFGINDVALAGGVFSNVKANMQIRRLDALKRWYVFPHMGDGGIALGSALYVNNMLTGTGHYKFSAYMGPSYEESETERTMKKEHAFVVQHESPSEQASHAAELISDGNYIFWFQNRMEFGPRALGNRSILAPSGSEDVKERLNLYVKKREWFQPFAPSILEEDVASIVEYDGKGLDKFMTMGYPIKSDMRKLMASTIHVDGSARPQMVGSENELYHDLIRNVKRMSGIGAVLNTSFNIHGLPIVMSPQDALETMRTTKTKYMFINGLFVTNRAGI
ncbi:MAG TPA: carbamoyltransferase C-terminal domain-containing protein [Candidatus Acidoferrum sp.]|nr:carbamoyltransferase C-terminal domain-containing protein [Candidatus Acidoferrum sp.]